MLLRSLYSGGTVFWRTFRKTDSVQLIGLKDGVLPRGRTVTYNHPAGEFKLEIKRLSGEMLHTADTHIFSNEDELIVLANGTLGRILRVDPAQMPESTPPPPERLEWVDHLYGDLSWVPFYVELPGHHARARMFLGVHELRE